MRYFGMPLGLAFSFGEAFEKSEVGASYIGRGGRKLFYTLLYFEEYAGV